MSNPPLSTEAAETGLRHVILDRDGVLNLEAPTGFVEHPDQWEWMPGALDALVVLTKVSRRLSVVTNQSCVGRGVIDHAALQAVHERMQYEARDRGAHIAAIYCCPHAPEDGCSCRKPSPLLVEQAIGESGIPPTQTVFVGDSTTDVQAGQAAGISTWLVLTGNGRATHEQLLRHPPDWLDRTGFRVFEDLIAVSRAVVSQESADWETRVEDATIGSG